MSYGTGLFFLWITMTSSFCYGQAHDKSPGHKKPGAAKDPFCIGCNIWQEMNPGKNYSAPEYSSKFVYEKNGVKKVFTENDYPWNDTSWKFVDATNTLVKEGVDEPLIHDFSLTDTLEDDMTESILTANGYKFMWFVRDPTKVNMQYMAKLRRFKDKARKMNIPFYVVHSAIWEVIERYKSVWNMAGIPFFQLDGRMNGMAMPGGPGLVLLKGATIQQKWPQNNYPGDLFLEKGKLQFK